MTQSCDPAMMEIPQGWVVTLDYRPLYSIECPLDQIEPLINQLNHHDPWCGKWDFYTYREWLEKTVNTIHNVPLSVLAERLNRFRV